MIKGHATLEGTQKYAARQADARGDFFTQDDHFCLASLGFGSFVPEPYKEENYSFSYADAITAALRGGSNLIDTAANYRYGQSEKEIGEALKSLIDSGEIARDEVVVCSKGGFLPLCYPFPANPYEWIRTNIVDAKLATLENIALDQHCMTPAYIQWSLELSLANLGLETIDIYYLHNPETQLGFAEPEKFYEDIKAVFMELENARKQGKIGMYGVATWNAFLYEPTHLEYISLSKLVSIAREVGGENHGFAYIQMPFNLGKPHAYVYQNQEIDGLFYTPLQAVKKLGLGAITSSSLLQMNLFKGEFSESFRTLIGLEYASDVHRALQFARSATGVSSSLAGSKVVEHVTHDLEIKKFAKTERLSYEKILNL
jgi:aryl-alcohol dehydrogenase-like predicted oxidoreductase